MAKFSWEGAGSGALSGAGAGSATGNPFITAASSIIGALTGGFFGGAKKPKTESTLDKRQRSMYDQLYQGLEGQGPFANLFSNNPEALKQFYQQSLVDPAMKNFEQVIAPGIMGQFRGQNLQDSSYAGNAIAQAGMGVQNDLNSQLARLLYQNQNDALGRRMTAIDRLMGMNTQARAPESPSGIGNLMNQFAPQGTEMFFKYLQGAPQGPNRPIFGNNLVNTSPSNPSMASFNAGRF